MGSIPESLSAVQRQGSSAALRWRAVTQSDDSRPVLRVTRSLGGVQPGVFPEKGSRVAGGAGPRLA